MRNPFMFVVELMRQVFWVRVWVVYLFLLNLGCVLFWEQYLARIIFAVLLLSTMFMMALYSWFGYERILGLGHILWFPLLYALVQALPSLNGSFKLYAMVLIATNSVSLVIDISDVWRYFRSR